ncbi:MAG: hypothetical protein U0992_04030 [Planctomycetaceae bacterium]
MRDWTRLLVGALGVCLVVLGAGLIILERRISDLEAQLRAARSEIAAASKSVNAPLTVALAPSTTQRIPVQPRPPVTWTPDGRRWQLSEGADGQTPIIVQPDVTAPAPLRERRPTGEINGVPYYVVPLAKTNG